MISTSSILTVNLFFNSLIKLSTRISGAEAPEETPIVFAFLKTNAVKELVVKLLEAYAKIQITL